MVICVCDGSVEGIFSAIYRAWHIGTSKTKIQIGEQDMELFAQYEYIENDEEAVKKVTDTIINKISPEAYNYIYLAALSQDMDRGEAIYRFMILGIKMGARVVECMADENVCKVIKLRKRVWYENHHFLGFLRFQEYQGVLVARYEPKSNILALTASHFEDRLSVEDWIIIDVNRGLGAFHKKGYPFVISKVTKEQIDMLKDIHDDYQAVWKVFFDTIAIKERENYKLQRNNIPLWFRKNMGEFEKDVHL